LKTHLHQKHQIKHITVPETSTYTVTSLTETPSLFLSSLSFPILPLHYHIPQLRNFCTHSFQSPIYSQPLLWFLHPSEKVGGREREGEREAGEHPSELPNRNPEYAYSPTRTTELEPPPQVTPPVLGRENQNPNPKPQNCQF